MENAETKSFDIMLAELEDPTGNWKALLDEIGRQWIQGDPQRRYNTRIGTVYVERKTCDEASWDEVRIHLRFTLENKESIGYREEEE